MRYIERDTQLCELNDNTKYNTTLETMIQENVSIAFK